MIIWSSINCPTVIHLPTICYFSREKPLVKSTAPGSLSYYICLCDLYSFVFIFRYIKPKMPCHTLFYLAFDLSIYYNFLTSVCQFLAPLHERDWQPLQHVGLRVFVIVHGCYLRSVAWFSYCFDNLGLITEGNTYRRCAAPSLPLWGNTDVV